MAVWFDEPRWPAHGTLYGHLVSDTSLWELHDVARAAGLDPRAFDHDHYDLAERFVEAARAAGARQLPERELVVRLRASGLRILPHQHAPRRSLARREVRDAVADLLPPAILDGVIESYQQPRRHYHDVRHVAEMLRAQRRLAAATHQELEPPELLATLYHDVVYDERPGHDERASASRARAELTEAGLAPSLVDQVERLILLTIDHCPTPDDLAGARLVDADLAILGSAPGRYHVSVRDIRLEYGDLDDQQWTTGRRAALHRFLASPQLFTTPTARHWWLQSARANMTDELAHLPTP